MEDLNLNKFHMLTKYTNEDIAACKLTNTKYHYQIKVLNILSKTILIYQ